MRIVALILAFMAAPVSVNEQGSTSSGAVSQQEFLRVAVPLVSRWEGTGPTLTCEESDEGVCVRAYLDTIAEPDVWTVCYGDTDDVTPNEVRTIEECREELGRNLLRYRSGLYSYFTEDTIEGRLTPERDAAYTSLAYNVGVHGAGNSTATRRLNNGDIRGGCEALTWWNRAGDRVIRGLVNRRSEERDLCLQGLS